MYRNRVALTTVVALGCLSASCTKKSASDAGLTTDIQSKLYADASTKSANISVDVKDGVVTLGGTVPSSDVELEAMKVANGTAGVQSVKDQMKVDTASAGNQPPPTDTAAPQPTGSTPPASTYPPLSSNSAPPPNTAPTAVPAPPPPVATAPAPVAEAPAPERRRREPAAMTVAAGERLSVRMIDAIDSRKNSPGQTFQATLDSPLISNGRVAVPAGSPVTVVLENSNAAGRIKGQAQLSVRVTNISDRGHDYQVASSVYDEAGKSRGKQTAVRSGIGAAAGALIGGLAGGGKGAAIGAGAGGGAGLGYQFFTHGSQVKIPSETVLTFRLEAPLTISR